MKRTRKHFTAPEKMALLRRHLIDKTPVSTVCDEAKIKPTVFYRWQKGFVENGAAVFQPRGRVDDSADQKRIAYLEQKIQTKDEVLAELMAEHIALKNRLGSSERGLGPA